MKQLALSAISFYQRRMSPYKGFCCAYSAYTGHSSCSVLGYRAVQRYGVISGVAILRQRFERCRAAHRSGVRRIGARKGQSGVCDLACDVPCDPPCGDCIAGACDAAPCDCGDWWPSRKKSQAQKHVYVPPQRWG